MKLYYRLTTAIALGWLFAPHLSFAQDAAAACARLRGPENTVKFARIPDAPTTILSAKVVPAGGGGSIIERDLPEICRVESQIAPTVGFLLRLPTKTWNGKFMMGGCGGPCGNYLNDRIDAALVRNYAVVVTDMGHKGNGWIFGYNNLQGQIDFGYRATHVTAVASKVIIEAFYGKKASRNYFWGCSTGGRQALVEAQRFPEDFEGIIAGAPPWSQTGHQPYVVEWRARANRGKDGKPILDAGKLPLTHNAVLEACDAADGLKDGVLQDPRTCKWDPSMIQCKPGVKGQDCLTPEEAEVVRKFYDGPRNSKGERLYFGWPRGTELKWSLQTEYVGAEDSMLHYLAFCPAPGPSYSRKEFDYDRDPPRLALTDWIFNHTNPDLKKFKAAGGKLILFHGWDDSIPAEFAIDYYETATGTMGGDRATKDFFRLFMAPGMDHCRYGIGGGEVDWITYLENWVEKGQAPEFVVAYHMIQEPYPSIERPIGDPAERYVRMARHPLPASSYDRARPIYAYPDVARWSGRGDPNQPTSWERAPR